MSVINTHKVCTLGKHHLGGDPSIFSIDCSHLGFRATVWFIIVF